MPLTVEPLKKVGKSADELAKELAKATEEASKLRRARMEEVQLQKSMQQATQLGQRQMGTSTYVFGSKWLEEVGFVKPTITGPEIMKTLPTSCYHNCKNGRLRQTKQCSTSVVQLVSFLKAC